MLALHSLQRSTADNSQTEKRCAGHLHFACNGGANFDAPLMLVAEAELRFEFIVNRGDQMSIDKTRRTSWRAKLMLVFAAVGSSVAMAQTENAPSQLSNWTFTTSNLA
jgi:hypothetical protein